MRDDSLGGLEDVLSTGAPLRQEPQPALSGQGPNAAWPSSAYAWDARDTSAYGRPGNRNSSAAIAIVCLVMFLGCILVGRAYNTARVQDVGGEGLSSQDGRSGLGASDTDRSGQDADIAANVPPADGDPKAGNGTGSADAGAAGAPDQPTDDNGISSNWRDQEFSIDGHKFTMGSFTAGEFMEQTGWTVDESMTAANTQIDLRDQTPIFLHHPSYGDRGDVLLMLGVTNKTSAASDIQDRKVTSLIVFVALHSGLSYPDFEIAGGIRLCGTSPDQAKDAIPARPVQDVTSEKQYDDYTYTQRAIMWDGGNADYGLVLIFDKDEDELCGICMVVRDR